MPNFNPAVVEQWIEEVARTHGRMWGVSRIYSVTTTTSWKQTENIWDTTTIPTSSLSIIRTVTALAATW